MPKPSCSLDGCDKLAAKRGWCHMHYLRWYRTGDVGEAAPRLIQTAGRNAGRKPIPIATRLLRATLKTGTCWYWRGELDRHGYGVLEVCGKGKRVHRLSYEAFVGPIPAGLVIDHLCRVRDCINPDHLEPVTSQENTRRGNVGKHWAEKRAAASLDGE